MLTKHESDKLKRLVASLVKAAIDNSWAGAGDPADIDLLQADYDIVQTKFRVWLKANTLKENN